MVLATSFAAALFFSLFAATALAIFFVDMRRRTNNRSLRNCRLPPGNLGLLWIGETMDFFRAQRSNHLFESFIQPRAAKHGNIFKTRLLGSPTVVVNGADANRFFLSNEFKLVVSSWPSSAVQLMGKNSIMEKEGDAHRRLRGLIAASLSSVGLETMVPKICESVQSHLNKYWKNRSKIKLFCTAKILTFTVVFECLLGIKVEPESLETFERVLEGVFAVPVGFPGSKFWRAKRARKEIGRKLVEVIREKRKEMEEKGGGGEGEGSCGGGGNLVGRLVAGMIMGQISEEEVADNVVLLVFAAHDTTSFAIAMTFRMLALHPHCFSLLLQEHAEILKSRRDGEPNLTLEDIKKMKYTWQVARESMRLFPPIFGSFRKAITDIEFEGFIIPKGWKVLWTAYGTHYNSEYFPNPTTFDPSRFEEAMEPYVYVPFGGGARACAGSQLAKLNMLIFVHYVVTRYEWSLQYPDEAITMDPLPFPCHGMPINISPKLL